MYRRIGVVDVELIGCCLEFGYGKFGVCFIERISISIIGLLFFLDCYK